MAAALPYAAGPLRAYSEAEWQRDRALIRNMFKKDGKTVTEIKRELALRFGRDASIEDIKIAILPDGGRHALGPRNFLSRPSASSVNSVSATTLPGKAPRVSFPGQDTARVFKSKRMSTTPTRKSHTQVRSGPLLPPLVTVRPFQSQSGRSRDQPGASRSNPIDVDSQDSASNTIGVDASGFRDLIPSSHGLPSQWAAQNNAAQTSSRDLLRPQTSDSMDWPDSPSSQARVSQRRDLLVQGSQRSGQWVTGQPSQNSWVRLRSEHCLRCVLLGKECDNGSPYCAACANDQSSHATGVQCNRLRDWLQGEISTSTCNFCSASGLSKTELCQHMAERHSGPGINWRLHPGTAFTIRFPKSAKILALVTLGEEFYTDPLLVAVQLFFMEGYSTFDISDLQRYVYPVCSPHNRVNTAEPNRQSRLSDLPAVDSHIRGHEKLFGCTFDDCYELFSSEREWDLHEEQRHQQESCWRCHICRDVFFAVGKFVDHALQQHWIFVAEDSNLKQESWISWGNQQNFWCGFCDEIILHRKSSTRSARRRSNHIWRHFVEEKRKPQDWIELTAHGMTKAQIQSGRGLCTRHDLKDTNSHEPSAQGATDLSSEVPQFKPQHDDPLVELDSPAVDQESPPDEDASLAARQDTFERDTNDECAAHGSQSSKVHLWKSRDDQDETPEEGIGKLFELEIAAFLKEQDIQKGKTSPALWPHDMFQLFRFMLWSLDLRNPAWQEAARKARGGFDPKEAKVDPDHLQDMFKVKYDSDPQADNCDHAQDISRVKYDLDSDEAKLKPERADEIAPEANPKFSDSKPRPVTEAKVKKEIGLQERIEVIPEYASDTDEPASEELSPMQSDDSYMESSGEESFISDDTCSPLWDTDTQQHIETLTSNIAQQLAKEYLATSDGITKCPERASHDSSGSSGIERSSHAAVGSSTAPTTVTKRSSRKRRARDEDDEDDGRRRKRNQLDPPDPADGDAEGLLACPYTKYDPARYSEANQNLSEKAYRRCRTVYLSNIPRLKQHLYRVHRRPEYYCSSCYMEFGSENESDVHTRSRLCLLRDCPFDEKMTSDQCKAVKRRRMGETSANAWFGIFDVLFPGAEKPENPFVECSNTQEVVQSVQDYTVFLERQLPLRLSQTLGGPLFNADPMMYQWLINMALEETLPLVLQNLQAEYQTLHPVEQEDEDPGSG